MSHTLKAIHNWGSKYILGNHYYGIDPNDCFQKDSSYCMYICTIIHRCAIILLYNDIVKLGDVLTEYSPFLEHVEEDHVSK